MKHKESGVWSDGEGDRTTSKLIGWWALRFLPVFLFQDQMIYSLEELFRGSIVGNHFIIRCKVDDVKIHSSKFLDSTTSFELQ
jgi:hypothetical protein